MIEGMSREEIAATKAYNRTVSWKEHKHIYNGFTRHARIIMNGFDSIEKGLRVKHEDHKTNKELWAKLFSYLAERKPGDRRLQFDILKINDNPSNRIENAAGYCWKAKNHDANVRAFNESFKVRVAAAKAAKAKSEPAIQAKAEPAIVVKTEKGAA